MSLTEQAIANQAASIEKLVNIVDRLLLADASNKEELAKAKAEAAELIAADGANAEQVQSLTTKLDDLFAKVLAAVPSEEPAPSPEPTPEPPAPVEGEPSF